MTEASTANITDAPDIRHDWLAGEADALFALPFNDLLFRAQTVHRVHFDANRVQIATLLSIKTGGCPEDCAYCPQSARYETGIDAEKLMDLDDVLAAARGKPSSSSPDEPQAAEEPQTETVAPEAAADAKREAVPSDTEGIIAWCRQHDG